MLAIQTPVYASSVPGIYIIQLHNEHVSSVPSSALPFILHEPLTWQFPGVASEEDTEWMALSAWKG